MPPMMTADPNAGLGKAGPSGVHTAAAASSSAPHEPAPAATRTNNNTINNTTDREGVGRMWGGMWGGMEGRDGGEGWGECKPKQKRLGREGRGQPNPVDPVEPDVNKRPYILKPSGVRRSALPR